MMQPWFPAAKLGIFIHWGIYAVGRPGGESWPIASGTCSHDEYMTQMADFTAKDYDPAAWAALCKRAGARYAVLTTKHHDGVTLWPTRQGSPSIPDEVGCGDLIGPFVDALRAEGIHPGLYFSHTDWTHMGHVGAITGESDETIITERAKPSMLRERWARGTVNSPGFFERWESFLAFHRAQLTELLTSYSPDLLWFDVMMGGDRYDYRCLELKAYLEHLRPGLVINSRLQGHGDYETPEKFIPVYPPEGPWELCMAANKTWSFRVEPEFDKTLTDIITMFSMCLSRGGNLLLNVAPDRHGIICDRQIALLEGLGDWIRRNEEAVYPARRGLPHGYTFNPTALSPDRRTLYVYLTHRPRTGEATPIEGIRNTVNGISLLGDGTQCGRKLIGGAPWLDVPPTLWVEVPESDDIVPVLKIELDGELDLYGGQGVEIDNN